MRHDRCVLCGAKRNDDAEQELAAAQNPVQEEKKKRNHQPPSSLLAQPRGRVDHRATSTQPRHLIKGIWRVGRSEMRAFRNHGQAHQSEAPAFAVPSGVSCFCLCIFLSTQTHLFLRNIPFLPSAASQLCCTRAICAKTPLSCTIIILACSTEYPAAVFSGGSLTSRTFRIPVQIWRSLDQS